MKRIFRFIPLLFILMLSSCEKSEEVYFLDYFSDNGLHLTITQNLSDTTIVREIHLPCYNSVDESILSGDMIELTRYSADFTSSFSCRFKYTDAYTSADGMTSSMTFVEDGIVQQVRLHSANIVFHGLSIDKENGRVKFEIFSSDNSQEGIELTGHGDVSLFQRLD